MCNKPKCYHFNIIGIEQSLTSHADTPGHLHWVALKYQNLIQKINLIDFNEYPMLPK